MSYSSEEEYNYGMSGEAEAEAQQHQDYNEYLNELSTTNPYLYALEVAQDIYTSKDFKKSGLDFGAYISQMKEAYLNPKQAEPDEIFDSRELQLSLAPDISDLLEW